MTDLGLAHHILIHPKKCTFWRGKSGLIFLNYLRKRVSLYHYDSLATFS